VHQQEPTKQTNHNILEKLSKWGWLKMEKDSKFENGLP